MTTSPPDAMADKNWLRIGETYTFNIAPADKYQYFDKPPKSLGDFDRLKMFTKHWTKFMKEFDIANIKYYLQTELSTPFDGKNKEQRSRLHYHGIIYFPDKEALTWFLLYATLLLYECATFKIDTIKDPIDWHTYVHKQKELCLPRLWSDQFASKPYEIKNNNLNIEYTEDVKGNPRNPKDDGESTPQETKEKKRKRTRVKKRSKADSR